MLLFCLKLRQSDVTQIQGGNSVNHRDRDDYGSAY